jgi:hypothetical protein
MVEREYESEYKAYVRVQALFYPDGRPPEPQIIWWEDGRQYEIDNVGQVCRAASTKAGGIGIRYSCRVRGKSVYLYYDDAGQKWFMERREPKPCAEDTKSSVRKK